MISFVEHKCIKPCDYVNKGNPFSLSDNLPIEPILFAIHTFCISHNKSETTPLVVDR